MTSLWLWPVIFFLMPAQASFMRPHAGGACSPTGTAVQPHMTIVCQGVNPPVLELLNTVLDTADLDLHGKIRQAAAWVRTYHALVQRLAEGGRDHRLIHAAHALVQARKLAEAGALLDLIQWSRRPRRNEARWYGRVARSGAGGSIVEHAFSERKAVWTVCHRWSGGSSLSSCWWW